MALTIDTSLYGSKAVSDPEAYVEPLRTIRMRIDFGAVNAAKSTNYAFMWLPKGFLMKGVKVRELAKCSASTTVTLKTKGDEATIGSVVNVGGSALADTYMVPVKTGDVYVSSASSAFTASTAMKLATGDAGAKYVAAGDMLCLVLGAAVTAGVIEVTVFGISTDGQSFAAGLTPPPEYRIGQTDAQFEGNVSGGDLLNPNA